MKILHSPLFILALLLTTFTLNSQSKYEFIYDFGYSDIVSDAVRVNGKIFMLGTQEEEILVSPGSFLLVSVENETGQVIDTKTFSDSIYQNLFGVRITYSKIENSLILLGAFDGAPDKIGLIKTDLSGNEQWRVDYYIHDYLDNYSSDGSLVNYDILSFTDTSYIIVFSAKPDIEDEHIFDKSNIILAKFNKMGDHLWTKEYPFYFHARDTRMYPYDDTTFLLSSSVKPELHDSLRPLDFCPKDAFSLLMKLNTNGDTLWTKIYVDTPYHCGTKNVSRLNDGSIILSGLIDTSCIVGGHAPLWVVKTDSEGNYLWSDYYWRTVYNGIGLSIADRMSKAISVPNSKDFILFLEENSNEVHYYRIDQFGEVVWRRVDQEHDFLPRTLISDKESGFFAIGAIPPYASNSGTYDIYLAKFDWNGQLIMTSSNNNIQTPPQLKIYPNPTNNTIIVNGLPNDTNKLMIFDINGKELISRNVHGQKNLHLPFNGYTNGTYLLSIFTSHEVITKKFIKN